MAAVEIPKKYKALVYDNPGTISTKVVELDTPEPGPGEVLINLYVVLPVLFKLRPLQQFNNVVHGPIQSFLNQVLCCIQIARFQVALGQAIANFRSAHIPEYVTQIWV